MNECAEHAEWQRVISQLFRVIRCAHFGDQQITDAQGQNPHVSHHVHALARSSTRTLAVEYEQVTSDEEADRIWNAMQCAMLACEPIGQRYDESRTTSAAGDSNERNTTTR